MAAATVLIVDDDPSVRASLTRLVSASGYKAVAFADADAFLDHVERNGTAPACVVLDLHLPGLCGLELQQVINRRQPPVPVVVLTGSDDARELTAARAAGAVRVLSKPCDPAVLLAAVATAAQPPPPSWPRTSRSDANPPTSKGTTSVESIRLRRAGGTTSTP